MNSLKLTAVSLIALFGLIGSGCKKSDESSRDPGGVSAVFTLGGAPGNCTGAALGSGGYVVGTALGSTNTVTLQVTVTTAGAYSISTSSVNGISFSGSGTFASTGAQTVTLAGTGTPAAAGANNYSVTAGGNSCAFSVTATGGGGSAAVFTLGGAGGSCTGATTAGTYAVGTALTAANTASIQVNVTTAGTYSITTSSANSISFSGSGTFASTGTKTVILTGSGTPAAAGANNYTVTAGGGSCTFSVTATGAATISAQFNACDDMTDWEISGDKPKGPMAANKKEGTNWLEADMVDGVDYLHFIYRRPSGLNAGVTEANGQLRFWFYASDVSQMRLSGPGVDPGQIELTSSGLSDFNEYNWNTDSVIGTLHNGWNEVKLDFSKAYKTPDGGPNVAAFNLFRIYFWTSTTVHPTTLQFGLDDIRIQEK